VNNVLQVYGFMNDDGDLVCKEHYFTEAHVYYELLIVLGTKRFNSLCHKGELILEVWDKHGDPGYSCIRGVPDYVLMLKYDLLHCILFKSHTIHV